MVFNVGGNGNSEITADRVKYNDGTVSSALNTVEDELTANGKRIYLDYQDGKYGYNTDAGRGADTFNPFKSGGEPELLWTNASPFSAFGYETIRLSLSNYNAVMIKVKRNKNDNTSQYEAYYTFRVPSNTAYIAGALVYNQQTVGAYRKVTVSNTSVIIDYNVYNNMLFGDNNIPIAIYGVTDELI